MPTPNAALPGAAEPSGIRAGGSRGRPEPDPPVPSDCRPAPLAAPAHRRPDLAHTRALRRLPGGRPVRAVSTAGTASAQMRAPEPPLLPTTSYSIAMTERILMIEDDVDLASMLGEYLRGAGVQVDAVHDAASGLAALSRAKPDAVILDVMLPDLDGFEVCRRIRASSDVPVIMLTARGDDADRIVGLELGADDYLPKPFNPRELLARIRAVLRRSARAASSVRRVMRFGRLEIDADSRQVTLGDDPCHLTGYQFDVLHVLASNAGRVMSREQLMDRLRGESLEAFDRSIDVHVSRIRAAVEDDPHNPRRIITVRGAGYVFASEQD